jgi:phosphatidylglycerophosphatase C
MNLAIFDLDGTISRRDTLLPYIAGYLWRHPWRLWRWASCILPVLRYATHRDRGLLKGEIVHATLGGLTRAQLARWTARFVRRLEHSGLHAEARDCIAAHRRSGDRLVLLSASPDLYVPQIAEALGFDGCLCTELRWHPDGRLDGALVSANRRGEEKALCVRSLLDEQRPALSYAYGNSPSDLAHLALVTAGTYVNGTPEGLAQLPNVHAVRWGRR